MENKKDPKNRTIQENGDADVIVLGVGTAGEDLSLQLLDAGLDVIGIEPNLVGGECPYWACLPSKIMVQAARYIKKAGRINEMAGEVDISPDWEPVAEKVRWMTGGWDDSTARERYRTRGGKLIKGYGKLTGPRTVSVGDQSFTARRGIVIATGSKPFIPPIPGLEDVDYWTTHDVIAMEEIPESMIVIGAGSSGCELAQVAAQFGSDITFIESEDRILHKEEPEASSLVEESFASLGINVRTGVRAERVQALDDAIQVSLDNGEKLSAERLFIATGRTVDLSDLGLESVGLDGSASFIDVDENLRAADGIWAMGDVTGDALLSLVAVSHSNIVAAEILGKDHPPVRYDAVPRVTFTEPEVGSVGLTESEARADGRDVIVVVKQMPATFAGIVHWLEHGFIKLIVDRETATLIGATVAGPQAGNVFGMLNLAVHARTPLNVLQSMLYGFPGLYSTIGEAIGAYGRGVTTVVDPEYQGLKALEAIE